MSAKKSKVAVKGAKSAKVTKSSKAKKPVAKSAAPKASKVKALKTTVAALEDVVTPMPSMFEPTVVESPKKAKGGEAKKKLSLLDSAAKVLAENGGVPVNARDLIAIIASAGLWESPKGKTPHQTLAAAIGKEIAVKGKASRFAKAGRGLFAAKA